MNMAQMENNIPSKSSARSKPVTNVYRRDIPAAQQAIYDYLINIVQTWPAEDVLTEFRYLFIHHVNTASSVILPALYEIVFSNHEQEFCNTLKRSCYILINNWDISRNHDSIGQLIALFSDPILERSTPSPTLKRLRTWLKNFVSSRDFEELRLFTTRYDSSEVDHWSQRYASYLLVPQYVNLSNSVEQREAARALSRKLKEKFKLNLAFYTALSNPTHQKNRRVKNPTFLGDESLKLVKRVVARRGMFNYSNLANIFRNQIQDLNYRAFKSSFKEYLFYALDTRGVDDVLKKQFVPKIEELYKIHESKPIDDALLLRTSNRFVSYLTTEDRNCPSPLFLGIMSQGNPLILVIMLLKIVLMCPHVRTHLEARVADLIRYYRSYSEEECKWVVIFFDVFNITMTIHAENTDYTLVNMQNIQSKAGAALSDVAAPKEYRVFSQHRLASLIETESEDAILNAAKIDSEEQEEADSNEGASLQ
ncbi:MAG: hypothetical protein WBA57_22945 [Elainellaceae cyanobacterium]